MKKLYLIYKITFKHKRTGKRYSYIDFNQIYEKDSQSLSTALQNIESLKNGWCYLVRNQYELACLNCFSRIYTSKKEVLKIVGDNIKELRESNSYILDYEEV